MGSKNKKKSKAQSHAQAQAKPALDPSTSTTTLPPTPPDTPASPSTPDANDEPQSQPATFDPRFIPDGYPKPPGAIYPPVLHPSPDLPGPIHWNRWKLMKQPEEFEVYVTEGDTPHDFEVECEPRMMTQKLLVPAEEADAYRDSILDFYSTDQLRFEQNCYDIHGNYRINSDYLTTRFESIRDALNPGRSPNEAKILLDKLDEDFFQRGKIFWGINPLFPASEAVNKYLRENNAKDGVTRLVPALPPFIQYVPTYKVSATKKRKSCAVLVLRSQTKRG
jgi:hypothetical protein